MKKKFYTIFKSSGDFRKVPIKALLGTALILVFSIDVFFGQEVLLQELNALATSITTRFGRNERHPETAERKTGNAQSGANTIAKKKLMLADTEAPKISFQGSALLPGLKGISSSQTPYLLPGKPGVQFKSIITSNDVVGGYRMAGIPDGLGAFDNGDGTFTVLMNHEIGNTLGTTRAHGSIGSFVSKWVINKSDLSVVSGSDLMRTLYLWDTTAKQFVAGTRAFSRFCSADLPAVSAFYNPSSGLGTTERIFMDGEESGAEGKALGHIVTGPNGGTSYELPYLGKFAWENVVASPTVSDTTVVAGMDDGTGGQVYFYIGTKTNTGTEIDKAGLNNGKLFGVSVSGMTTETSGGVPSAGTRFSLVDLGSVQNKTGAQLETASVTGGVTTFLRPEDGAWDPVNKNDFYFQTTNAFTLPSRLWRLRFDNASKPELGGTIEAVLDGTEGQKMLDNMSVDRSGNIIGQEDVGNNAHIGKVWQYNIATDLMTPIAYHDSSRFLIGGANFLTQDEESSGVMDASDILGAGWYLLDVQAHYGIPGEVVEGGQLLAMYNPLVFGTATALDTIRAVAGPAGTVAVNLGTPATYDNCTVASVTNNAPAVFPVDTTKVTWTVTDGNNNTATVTQVVIVTQGTNIPPKISFLSPGASTSFPSGSTIPVQLTASDTDGVVKKVELFYNGIKFGVDSTAPFSFTGENVEEGIYKLVAIATDDSSAVASTDTLTITVTGCSGSGSISGEGFTNIPGTDVADLTNNVAYPNNPSINAQLVNFEYSNVGDNYGGRVRGYICAPETGNYIFYVAGDDQAGLYLSTDDNPANKVLIAYNFSPVKFRAFNTFATQKSALIKLVKGARYYIETLHKQGIGSNHLSVAWRLPNGVFETPIPGSRLSPFNSPSLLTSSAGGFEETMRKATTDRAGLSGLMVTATPNPSTAAFTVRLKGTSSEKLSLHIMDVTGRVVEKSTNVNPNSAIQIGIGLRTGIYFLEVIQGKERKVLKLIKE